MFTSKQVKLMNALGIVSNTDQNILYDSFCEVSCEMRAEGQSQGSFTSWLERKIAIAEYVAKRNATTV